MYFVFIFRTGIELAGGHRVRVFVPTTSHGEYLWSIKQAILLTIIWNITNFEYYKDPVAYVCYVVDLALSPSKAFKEYQACLNLSLI